MNETTQDYQDISDIQFMKTNQITGLNNLLMQEGSHHFLPISNNNNFQLLLPDKIPQKQKQ